MAVASFKDIINNKFNLAPSQLKVAVISNRNTVLVRDLLDRQLKFSDNGNEIGSVNYISKSTHFFIRSKALQPEFFLLFWDNESVIPIRPQVFKSYDLKKDDIILSKDSNIGEAAILDRDYPNYTISGALYKLPITKRRYYLLAFLKHHYFKEQLDILVPKGSTIRHAKTRFLDCKIPFPNQKNSDEIIKHVELLTKAVINKEKEIRRKNQFIFELIRKELFGNQKSVDFHYIHPSVRELKNKGRIDAGFYCEKFKRMQFTIKNYKNGYSTLDKQGLTFKPGPSLEIRLLGTRIDSKEERAGFYRLVTPKQITNFGTVLSYSYLGTAYKIPTLQKKDIVFGESGTGRSFVYLEDHTKTITNAHGHVLRTTECSLEKVITIRCLLAYLKTIGFIDLMTVGGSGGHLSPSYFDRVIIPNFPEKKQKEIAKLYHNPIGHSKSSNLSNFLKEDNKWNKRAGIIELDKSAKELKKLLNNVLDKIINDEESKLNILWDKNKKG